MHYGESVWCKRERERVCVCVCMGVGVGWNRDTLQLQKCVLLTVLVKNIYAIFETVVYIPEKKQKHSVICIYLLNYTADKFRCYWGKDPAE